MYMHEGVYFCENAHMLRHRSEHTCSSTIYYQVEDLVMKVLHFKAKYNIHLKPDLTLLDARKAILLFNLPKPLTLVCAL